MSINQKEIIHIIGIGGIGMSAIAEILHNLSYKVQGSDAHSSDNTDKLKKLGIEVYIGHNAANINQAHTIVYSSAIKSYNVELIAARNMGKIVIHRSDIFAELVRDKYVIAVSGSSGKTTTTAMIASIFDHSNRSLSVIQEKDLDSSVTCWNGTNVGIDATVIVGGILNAYQSNSKFGKSDIFLIEADESDGTMLKIPSNIAVITSINDDHIDHYGTFDDIKRAFSQFIEKADYAVIPCSVGINYNENNTTTFGFEGDNTVIQVLYTGIKKEGLNSNIACWNDIKVSNVRARNIQQHANGIEFDISINHCGKKYSVENMVLSNAIGIHKVSNALAAISVAIKLGISVSNIRKGLAEFKGVKRRFSIVADVNGVRLIEDYAHHPNEIYATLTAARSIDFLRNYSFENSLVTKGKVIGIIEPLRFARIRNFFDEFIRIFMMFDYVILTSVHPPEDKPIPGYGIEDIQKALINREFCNVKIINDSLLISRFISNFTNFGDIVLFIGAGGNITKLAKETA
ncbi:MAG: Mur ligase domain-containing protein [Wolbachia sp.]|nr:Mur ligase domain-containing protein [Wolbachia sp.]